MTERRRRRALADLVASTRRGDIAAMDQVIGVIVRCQDAAVALYWSIHQLTEANATMVTDVVGSADSAAVSHILFGEVRIDTLRPADRAAARILLAAFAGHWSDIDRQLELVAANAGTNGWIEVLSDTVEWTNTLIDCCTSAGQAPPRWLKRIPTASGYLEFPDAGAPSRRTQRKPHQARSKRGR